MHKYLNNLKNNTCIKIEICETDTKYLASMGIKISVIADATNSSRFSKWTDITYEVADLLYVEMNKTLKKASYNSTQSLYKQMLEVAIEVLLSEIKEGNIKDLKWQWIWSIV